VDLHQCFLHCSLLIEQHCLQVLARAVFASMLHCIVHCCSSVAPSSRDPFSRSECSTEKCRAQLVTRSVREVLPCCACSMFLQNCLVRSFIHSFKVFKNDHKTVFPFGPPMHPPGPKRCHLWLAGPERVQECPSPALAPCLAAS